MRSWRQPITALALTWSLLGSTGCLLTRDSLFEKAPGNYDGFVIKKIAPDVNQSFLQGTVSARPENDLVVHMTATDTKEVWNFVIHSNSHSEYELKSDHTLFKQTLSLNKDADNCASSDRKSFPRARVCYDEQELAIDYTLDSKTEYIFVLDLRVDNNRPKLEEPRAYSVPELLEMGKNQSFTSQVQFERGLMSRLNSKAAHLNLLPHISSRAIIGAITAQWTALPDLIADLAPFLIPSNWINASAASHQADADRYAWHLMRADSANLTEGLAYLILRDEATLTALMLYEQPITEMRDVVHDKEILGILPQGSTDSLTSMLNSLKETEIQLKKMITEQKRSLSLSAGLVNPNAITSIKENREISLEQPIELDSATTHQLVVARSMELRQIDALIEVADANALDRWFNWLVPSSNPNVSFGFGFPASIQAGKIPARELMIQRDQLHGTLLQKLENATDELNSSYRTYQISQRNAVTLKNRVDQLYTGMKTGLSVSVTDLQVAIADKMKGDVEQINNEYTYYTAVGKVNRLLLNGPYLDILTIVQNEGEPKQP